MTYTETIKRNNKKYYYLTKNVRLSLNKWKKVRIFLGEKKPSQAELKKYAKEIEYRSKPFLKLSDYAYLSEHDAETLQDLKRSYNVWLKHIPKSVKEKLNEDFVIRFTYHSNAIEGNRLTLRQTALILKDKVIPSGVRAEDYNEAINGKECLDYIKNYKGDLNKQFLEKINGILTKNTNVVYGGRIRFFDVQIQGSTHVPPPYAEVKKHMLNLFKWYSANKNKLHPFELAALIHAKLTWIHPFEDGNGRTTRAVMNFILMKKGFPMFFIPFEKREEYYQSLDIADKGDYTKYISKMLQLIIDQIRSYSYNKTYLNKISIQGETMIVMKFGGTSVKNAERMRNLSEIVKKKGGTKPVVVSSACSGITDLLILTANKAAKGEDYAKEFKEIKDRHHAIIKELNIKNGIDFIFDELKVTLDVIRNKGANAEIMDTIQSYGERLSTRIIAGYFNSIGMPARQFDAWDCGFITNDDFGKAELLPDSYAKIKSIINKTKEIPIITGFIGKTADGRITTLGRGGSDYSAALVGAAVDSEEIQIWTDVDGIMTANPKVVPEAKSILKISFDEAAELAFFGAKVLHPKTILPAMDKDIPVIVLNTYNPSHPGTTIVRDRSPADTIVKSIASKKGNILINVHSLRMLNAFGFMAKVFDILSDYKKSVDMVSTSEVNISLTVDDTKDLDPMIKELEEIAEVKVMEQRTIICVVGEGMHNIPGIAGRIFSSLGKNRINIEMISQGSSEINISFIVKDEDADKAVQVLHREFIK